MNKYTLISSREKASKNTIDLVGNSCVFDTAKSNHTIKFTSS